jgi:hypothetical protein
MRVPHTPMQLDSSDSRSPQPSKSELRSSRPARGEGAHRRCWYSKIPNQTPSLRAKRSNPSRSKESMDCFVAFAPRNDGRHTSAFPRRVTPECCQEFFALSNRGRGECRVPGAPAASCAHGVVSMHTSIHSEVAKIIRHPHAMVYGL